MPKEFTHSRVYPLRPRIWPWLVFALALALVLGLGLWAFVATTGGEGGN
jgi:hypothetical protein